jgi:uracil-DNA glycosylase
MSSLSSRQGELLRDVDARWLPLFDLDALATALVAIDAMGDTERTVPAPELIFEAFRYGAPADCGVAIVAQPEHSPQGMGFSVPATAEVPPALARIFECLERAKLRTGHIDPATGAAVGESGDVRGWAVQGVLMLSSALTSRTAGARAHVAAWAPFVHEFVRRFCAERAAAGATVQFLLWGADARAFTPVVSAAGHPRFEWAHPNHAFAACPHFELIAAAHAAAGRRAIVWDNRAPVVAFSDGSCPRNGAPGARAGFAAIITGGAMTRAASIIRGEVRPFMYEFVDDERPELGLQVTSTPAVPTNNRGELLGIIYCLLGALLGRAAGRFELVSDSKISVQTLLNWLPNRRRKGTAHELKNFDLVVIAERLLAQLRAATVAVALTHVNSHQRAPSARASARERFMWRGNDLADAHAAAALAGEVSNFAVELINAPAVFQRLH